MKILSSNPKAYFDYEIIDEFTAGIALLGWEVKSIKSGKVNIKGSYVRPFGSEIYVVGMNISKYMGEGEELRDRKLLLKKREIYKIIESLEQKGLTLVPLQVLLSKGLIKIKISLARGKKKYDKRESVMNRDKKIEAERFLKKSRL